MISPGSARVRLIASHGTGRAAATGQAASSPGTGLALDRRDVLMRTAPGHLVAASVLAADKIICSGVRPAAHALSWTSLVP
jgi:hypothetical protein